MSDETVDRTGRHERDNEPRTDTPDTDTTPGDEPAGDRVPYDDAMRTQHPALHGHPEGEVAKRSVDGSDGLTFRKVFVMGGPIPEGHPQHEANWVGVLHDAIRSGLHPKGKVQLADVEMTEPDRRGQVTTTATYEVEVEPASTDHQAHTTVAPSSDVVHPDNPDRD